MDVDIKTLFSNGGKCTRPSLFRFYQDDAPVPVPVEEIMGKYVLVFCSLAPLFSINSEYCRALINTYSHLRSDGVDIEMVVVPKMIRGWEQSESAFNHFLSGFPDGCLIIPFSSFSDCRDYIAKSLDLDVSGGPVVCLVLDPKHRVLHVGDTYIFEENGAASFPFTEERMKELWAQWTTLYARLNSFKALIKEYDCEETNRDPVSLNQLLCCSPSDRLNKAVHHGSQMTVESIPVSHLNDKTVGVYLFHNGRFMDELNKVHQCCIAQGKVFEIVIVYLAFTDDPFLFMADVSLALKQRNITSWWSFPYNDKMCRSLWQLYALDPIDKLIILDPLHQSSEPQGRAFISKVNVGTSAYPFTRESFLKKKVTYLKSLTLSSLLGETDQVLRVDGSVIPVAELRDKKVLLYFGEFISEKKQKPLFCTLLKMSEDIGLCHPDSVVLFIPLNNDELGHLVSPSTVTDLPWLIFPSPYVILLLRSLSVVFDRDVSTYETLSLTNKLFPHDLDKRECASETIVTFDTQGHILSRTAKRFLKDSDGKGIDKLFDDMLLVETFSELNIKGYADI